MKPFRFISTAATFVGLAAITITTATAQDLPLRQILDGTEQWELISEGHQFTEGPSADRHGNIYFVDYPTSQIFHVNHATKEVTLFAANSNKTGGMMIGPDGLLYAAQADAKRIVAYDTTDASFTVIAEGMDVNDLVVAGDGSIWFTDPPAGRIWYVSPDRSIIKPVAENLRPNGIILSHREGTIVTTDANRTALWAFRAEVDGSLTAGVPSFGPVELAFGYLRPDSDGLTVDTQDRVYVGTRAGIQVFDTEDRYSGIIKVPDRGKRAANLTFGGPDYSWLYIAQQDKVYRIKTQTTGVPYFARDYEAMDRERAERFRQFREERERREREAAAAAGN